MSIIQKINYSYVYVILIAVSVWIKAFEIVPPFNTSLIIVMGLSSIMLIWHILHHGISKDSIIGFCLLLVMFLCSKLTSLHWRSSTFYYTCLFVLNYLLFLQLRTSKAFTEHNFLNVVKWLIYVYTGVIALQQLCLLAGIEPWNYTMGEEGAYLNDEMRINGLSPEPSNISRYMMIFMMAYIGIYRHINGKLQIKAFFKANKRLFLCFLWSMLTIGSTTAVIFLPLVFAPFISRKNMILIIVCGLALFTLLSYLNFSSFQRALKFIPAVLSLNIDKIFEADHSGAYRVINIINLFQHYDLFSLNGIFGYGHDYDVYLTDRYLSNYLVPGTGGGGIFVVMLNYGMISFIILLIFIWRTCYCSFNKLPFWVTFFIISIQGINVQIFWCGLIFLAAVKYLSLNHGNS